MEAVDENNNNVDDNNNIEGYVNQNEVQAVVGLSMNHLTRAQHVCGSFTTRPASYNWSGSDEQVG